MAEIKTHSIEDKNTWETFLATRGEANFLHSWYWGEFYKRLNRLVFRRGFNDGLNLEGVLLAVVEPAKRGRHLIVPGGPIINWSNAPIVKAWVDEIKAIAHSEKCVFVRVRPQLSDTPENRDFFRSLGFVKAPMHLHAELTSQLDLTRTDDELKKGMRKGARYELNRSQKLGVQVEAVGDARYIDEFYELQLRTAKRQKFVPFSKRYLSEQFAAFAADNKVLMYRSTHQGQLLAMAFIIFYGTEADYHYGASTDLARQIPGAYLIQWEAIAEAKRRGCSRYNFWGVTEHGQTKHRFYGVLVFKRGFGGVDVAYLPAHDLVINKARYAPTYLFETGRRKLRRL